MSRPNITTQNPPFWHLSWLGTHGTTAPTVVVVSAIAGLVIITVFSTISQRDPVNPTLYESVFIFTYV